MIIYLIWSKYSNGYLLKTEKEKTQVFKVRKNLVIDLKQLCLTTSINGKGSGNCKKNTLKKLCILQNS